jgi:hypothetical protein
MKLKPVVDLSPVTLEEFTWNQQIFCFLQPLTLKPEWNEAERLFTVEYQDLNLYVFTESQALIIDEIFEQLAFLWDAYVDVEPNKLAPDALQLRERLMDFMVKV